MQILKRYLPPTMLEEELVQVLCLLFNEMDVNGDNFIQWEEFTSYIVESTMSDDVFTVDGGRLRQFRASAVQDQSRHESSIEHLRYFREIDKLICCEQRRKVKVYNMVCPVTLKSVANTSRMAQ